MKYAKLTWIATVTLAGLLTGLVNDTPLSAQEQTTKHTRYILKDLGTFGGPQSYLYIPDNYAQVLNNRGMVAGNADTSTPDPFPDFCFSEDCFVSHTFLWQNDSLNDLSALPGGASSAAFWISPNGLSAGLSENGQTDPLIPGFPQLRAVYWKQGQVTDLGTLDGGYESIATAVNSHGLVAGLSLNTIPDDYSMIGLGYQTRAFGWQNGVMRDLGDLGGPDAMANLVNEQGQIVGQSYTSSDPSPYCAQALDSPLTTGAFFWQNGKMTNLGSFGGTCTFASALNNHGQVVGISTLPGDLGQHPFLWAPGKKMKDLGTFGGDGAAIANNDNGQVVGWATYAAMDPTRAALWTKNGKITDLGAVGDDACGLAYSINLKGQVVGISVPDCDFSRPRAFLYENSGPAVDLNTLVPPGSTLYLAIPAVINDRGEIAGVGVLPNGDQHVFLLTPCERDHPEMTGCENDGNANVMTQRDPRTINPAASTTPRPTRPSGLTIRMLRHVGTRVPPK